MTRIEFRDYRPTGEQMLDWLTSMAYIYDQLHKGDPQWLHLMSTQALPSDLSTLFRSYRPAVTAAVRDVFESSSADPSTET